MMDAVTDYTAYGHDGHMHEWISINHPQLQKVYDAVTERIARTLKADSRPAGSWSNA